jgi:hypothetical protein
VFANGVWSYNFSSFDYNSLIKAGEFKNFGFNATPSSPAVGPNNVVVTAGEDRYYFDDFGETAEPPELKPEDYSVIYSTTSEWASGANIAVTVTNNSNASIDGWIVGFEMDRTISNAWDATELVSQFGAEYEFGATSYNRIIAAGQSVTFGMSIGAGLGGPEGLRIVSINDKPLKVIPEPRAFALIVGLLALGHLSRRNSKNL